jgi:2-polyprenyl-3-methyl-5-hydroxy-6-metoxy-1,4-benzoquinol methylase
MKPKRSAQPGRATRARAHVERTSRVYYHTPQQQGIDNRVKQLLLERCAPHIGGPTVLELGYVDGLWTDAMVSRGLAVDVVEGASRHVEHARQRYGGNSAVRVFHSLFEEFRPDRQYDTVLAGDMIRYVPDATAFLKRVRTWIRPGGRLVTTVPNGRSLHRRIGALMGLEPAPQALNAQDRAVGNLRTYDKYELRHLLIDAGFDVVELRGCFLKPLSSSQMTEWSDELLRAFLLAGDELEDYCWFLYAVSRVAPSGT